MKYITPETKSLTMQAQGMICAGSPAPAPGRSGELGTMNVITVDDWI